MRQEHFSARPSTMDQNNFLLVLLAHNLMLLVKIDGDGSSETLEARGQVLDLLQAELLCIPENREVEALLAHCCLAFLALLQFRCLGLADFAWRWLVVPHLLCLIMINGRIYII